MAAMPIQPGSKWRLRRGQHSGSIVEIQGASVAGTVKYKTIAGGRSVGSSSWDDEGRIHTRPQGEFFTLFEPVNGVRAVAGDTNGKVQVQPRFRQVNPPKPRPVSDTLTVSPSVKGVQVSLEMVSPQTAESWLKRGGINRTLSPSRVSKLAAAMRRNEWRITGESIKLDSEGKVRDGQHRLAAVVESGVPIQTLVVRGVDEEAFDVMDTGRSRNVADVLSIHGHKSIYGLQAAIRILMLLEQTGRPVEGNRESREIVTTVTALEYVRAHPEVEEGVRLGDTVRQVMAGGHGLWGAMLTLFIRKDPRAAEVFHSKLVDGEGLMKGDPILVLRNRLLAEMRQYITRDATQREMLAGTIIRTWNLWRNKETVETWTKLSWRPGRDPFPSVE